MAGALPDPYTMPLHTAEDLEHAMRAARGQLPGQPNHRAWLALTAEPQRAPVRRKPAEKKPRWPVDGQGRLRF